MDDVIKVLRDYALRHYEEGGHWVVETFEKADYLQALTEGGDLEAAKGVLKDFWELQNMLEQECRYE